MILTLATYLAGKFGFKDTLLIHKRIWLALMVAGFIILCVIGGLIFRACRTEPKIDEHLVSKAQAAIERQERAEMERVFVEAEVAEKKIDANVVKAHAQTHNAINDAKEKAAAMSNEELRTKLEALANQ